VQYEHGDGCGVDCVKDGDVMVSKAGNPYTEFRKRIFDHYMEAMEDCQIATGALAHLTAAEYYAWCLEKNTLAKMEMKRALCDFAHKRGLYGTLYIREIQPEDVGLIWQQITVGAGEDSFTLERDVKETCAVVIGGFYVNDTILREVDVWRNCERLHNWAIRDGMVDGYVFWGPADMLKLIFYPKSTSNDIQVSNTWLLGFVLVPDTCISATEAEARVRK
jgi:predicted DNA-binding protein